jgi:DNA-binding MarR family transcriptional regulator
MPLRKNFDTDVSDFAQAVALLVRRMRAASAGHGLSLTESAVMGRLARDGAATTADLARAESVKPQTMGTVIASLEEMAVVERKPHPTDGRQVMIELTTKGAALRKSVKDERSAWLAQAIAELDEEQLAKLFAAAKIIKHLAESS